MAWLKICTFKQFPWKLFNFIETRCLSNIPEENPSEVNIKLKQGYVRGHLSELPSKKTLQSFHGIPYALSPTKKLRFKDPVEHTEWKGVLDARQARSICPQKDLLLGVTAGDENCLCLNVYSLFNNSKKRLSIADLMPVMVWIHGGRFKNGSGDANLYGPDFIVNENIVLVTLNYRLGPFGFLCLHDDDIPGNAGAKDIIMALKWIRNNIREFGGDPRSVTVFGMESGAALAHSLMMSPMAKGLLHRVILQSGSLMGDWGITVQNKQNAKALAKLLGYTDAMAGKESLASFLRKVPATDIVEAVEIMTTSLFTIPFCLTIENASSNSYLTQLPKEIVAENKIAHLPMIIGYNEHEGMRFLPANVTSLKDVDTNFESIMPPSLNLTKKTPKMMAVADKIKKFYFGGNQLSSAYLPQLIDLLSDVHVTRGINETIKTHNKILPSIFYYKFSFEGKLNLFKKILHVERKGVSQGDEIFYLFKSDAFDVLVKTESLEAITRNRMVKMWTNFAKYSNPTPRLDDEIITEKWNQVNDESFNCMNITTHLQMKMDPFRERFKFWENLNQMLKSDSTIM